MCISRNLFWCLIFNFFWPNMQSFSAISIIASAFEVVSLRQMEGVCPPSSKTWPFRGRDARKRRPPAARGLGLGLSCHPWAQVSDQGGGPLGPGPPATALPLTGHLQRPCGAGKTVRSALWSGGFLLLRPPRFTANRVAPALPTSLPLLSSSCSRPLHWKLVSLISPSREPALVFKSFSF